MGIFLLLILLISFHYPNRNDIFFYQFQCPEDDPLCDTEGDEYYNEEYNSPVLQPDPNMSKTELTLDNLDIPSLGKCQKY